MRSFVECVKGREFLARKCHIPKKRERKSFMFFSLSHLHVYKGGLEIYTSLKINSLAWKNKDMVEIRNATDNREFDELLCPCLLNCNLRR